MLKVLAFSCVTDVYLSLCKGAKTCLKCWPFEMPFEQDLSECFCCNDVDDCQGYYCHGHWVVENKMNDCHGHWVVENK